LSVPLSGVFENAVVKIFPFKDPPPKHLRWRKMRLELWGEIFPDGFRKHVCVSGLHFIGDIDTLARSIPR
jgi:hypothetical protein